MGRRSVPTRPSIDFVSPSMESRRVPCAWAIGLALAAHYSEAYTVDSIFGLSEIADKIDTASMLQPSGLTARGTCPEYPSPYGPAMNCGRTVRQCGVLAIDTGLGTYGGLGGAIDKDNANSGETDQTNPPYELPGAKVHGLWFEGPPYGDSYCWDIYGTSNSYIPGEEWVLPEYPGTAQSCEDQDWVFDPEAYCASNKCDSAYAIPSCYNVKAGSTRCPVESRAGVRMSAD